MDVPLPILDCLPCGACCRDVGVPPYTVLELFRLPESVRAFVVGFVNRGDRRKGEPCAALEGNRCTIYRDRPAVCVNLEVGGEMCRKYRDRYGVTT